MCAWLAIHFLRSCRGPVLAGLGHPDVASGRCSGTALACATKNPFIASPRVGTQTPLRNLHRTRLLTRIFRRAVCGTSLQYSPPPLPRTLFPSRAARGSFPAAQSAPYLAPQGREKRKGMGRGRYVPSRHQGVRSGARTGSLQEQGTYRLYPLNLTQNKKPPTVG